MRHRQPRFLPMTRPPRRFRTAAGASRAPYASAWRLLLATTLLASVADAGLLTGGRSKQGEIAGETGGGLPTGFDYHLDMPCPRRPALVGPGNTLLDSRWQGPLVALMGALGVKVTAIDGASNISHITQRFVQQRELTRRFAKPCRTFDWVMMEAEHIPDAYEDTYLANLNCRCARACLLVEPARPPLGTGHVNPHEKMWVINKMKTRLGSSSTDWRPRRSFVRRQRPTSRRLYSSSAGRASRPPTHPRMRRRSCRRMLGPASIRSATRSRCFRRSLRSSHRSSRPRASTRTATGC